MKRNIAAVGLLLAAITSPALAQDTPQTSGADSRGIEVMLVQSADQASFDGKTLTLKGLAPTTVFFADRPERIVGHVSHADLVKSWMEGQDNFKADPPNAAFSILSDTGEPQVAIVELLNPKLEGDAISYDVTVLEGTLPESASQVALFIDPWIWRPRGWVRGPYVGPACHWSYTGRAAPACGDGGLHRSVMGQALPNASAEAVFRRHCRGAGRAPCSCPAVLIDA